MTKRDLAIELASRSQISLDLALHCIDSLMDAAIEALADGENITLRGFGTLKQVRRKAKKARHITAGTTIEVPAHNIIKFVPCPGLKEAVWQRN